MTAQTTMLFPSREEALAAWLELPTGSAQDEIVPHLHGQRTHSTAGCHGPRCRAANAAYIKAQRHERAVEQERLERTANG